jgi:lipopolysaccharide transport system permease protein
MPEPAVGEETVPVFELHPRPTKLVPWLKEIWSFREVIGVLARKDFQVRYKRASFGILWAVVLPLLQAFVFVVIFSRVGRFHHTPFNYPAYVLSGVLSWAYFSTTTLSSSTSIVDGSTLTDKVWFPRSLLVLVPAISNLFSLITSMILLVIAMPIVGAHLTWRIVLILPGILLLVAFTFSLGLVTSALHVYFRDVRFIVQAAVLVWFYITPIVYPASALHGLGKWLSINPMTGIIGIFQFAAAGPYGPMARGIAVSFAVTIVLFVVGLQANRRHDRLFVDHL